MADRVIFTGAIDEYFGYELGEMEYRRVEFETEVLDTDNYQGNAVVNYTDAATPFTRIIEHKWFEFGKDENGQDSRSACRHAGNVGHNRFCRPLLLLYPAHIRGEHHARRPDS